jgi:hypothetical protein
MAGYSADTGGDHVWVEIGDCGFHIDCEVTLNPMPVADGGATIGPPSGIAIQPNANEVHAFSIFNDGVVTVEQITCCSVTALGSYILSNIRLVVMKGCAIADPACADAESIAMHPNQKLAIVGGFDGRLFTATRDPAGNLSNPVPTSFSIGTIADRLVFDPGGKFLYVMSSQTNLIFGFSVDSNAGVLQGVPGSPWMVPGTSPADGVFAPIAIRLPAPH